MAGSYPSSNALLRASVSYVDPAAASGSDAQVVVDGAETPLTAQGLTDYLPVVGDRLLVTRVGSVVEIVQFLSRQVQPYPDAAEVEQIQADVAANSSAVGTLNTEQTALSASLATLNSVTLPGLNTQLTANSAAIATLNSTTIPGLNTSIAANAASINTLQTSTIPTLQTALTTAQGQINTLNATTIPGLNTSIAANASAISTLNTSTIPGLQSQLTTNANAITANTTAVNTLNNTTIPNLNTTIAANTADVALLKNTTVPALNTALTAAQASINTLNNTTIPGLNTTIAANSASISTLNTTTIPTINTALGTKAQVFYQGTQPATSSPQGSIWFNTANNYHQYVLQGTTWTDAGQASAQYVQSRGSDAITNGTGALQNNINFSGIGSPVPFTYDSTDAPTGMQGSFKSAVGYHVQTMDENVPVDPSKALKFSYFVKQKAAGITDGKFYSLALPIDAYGNRISPVNHAYTPNSLTTLAADLNPGDTTMTLTSSANWWPSTAPITSRAVVFWNFVDQGGKVWPANTYSRNTIPSYDSISGNVVTLSSAYTGTKVIAGTQVSNANNVGGTYMYGQTAVTVPMDWTQYSATVQGVITDGSAASFTNGWPQGVAQVQLGWLCNYSTGNQASQMSVAGVSFSDATAAQDMATAANALAASKNVVFHQSTTPTGTHTIGDQWFYTTNNNQLRIWDGTQWVVAQFGNLAVGALDASTITTGSIAAARITSTSISAGLITGTMIAANTITAADIAANTITATQIAATTLTSSQIVAGSITGDRLTANTITATQIAANTITAAQIHAATVTTTEIAASTITAANIAAASITGDRLVANTITAAQILGGTITGTQIAGTTITAANIAADTITATQIAASAITSSELAANAVIAGKINAGAVVAGSLAANSVTAAAMLAGTITSTQIASQTIVAGNIAAGTITSNEILAATITGTNIAATTITAANIVGATITATQLAANSVTATQLAANSVTAAAIQAGTITTTEIAANTITGGDIAALTITAANLAAGTITADKIAAGTITANEIATDTITANEIDFTTITGQTITGAVIETATTGRRAALGTNLNNAPDPSNLAMWNANSLYPGIIGPYTSGIQDATAITSPRKLAADWNAEIDLMSGSSQVGQASNSIINLVSDEVFVDGIAWFQGNDQGLSAQFSGLVNFPGQSACGYYGNGGTGTTIPSSTWTNVTGWTAQFPERGGVTQSSGVMHFTYGGVYLFVGSINMNPTITGNVFGTRFLVNGTTPYADVRGTLTANHVNVSQSVAVIVVNAGDSVALQAWQTTGSNMQLTNSASQQNMCAFRQG